MGRTLGRVMGGLVAAGAMIAVSFSGAFADDKEKSYTIEEIMKKGHGSKGLLKGISAEAKAGKWEDAQRDAVLLKAFGVALGKNKPEMGSAASWKKLTDQYKENTVAGFIATEKQGAKATLAARGKIQKSCGSSHKQHKPK
jgi:hypothetical protein